MIFQATRDGLFSSGADRTSCRAMLRTSVCPCFHDSSFLQKDTPPKAAALAHFNVDRRFFAMRKGHSLNSSYSPKTPQNERCPLASNGGQQRYASPTRFAACALMAGISFPNYDYLWVCLFFRQPRSKKLTSNTYTHALVLCFY